MTTSIGESTKKITDLVLNRPDLSLQEIADLTKVTVAEVLQIQENSKAGYIRALTDRKKIAVRLERVITDVTNNISDIHKHTIAMVEALQNSYRIKIVRDKLGNLHYQNMLPDWPTRPTDFDTLPEMEQKLHIITIDTPRLQSFISDLMTILSMRASNANFVTKVVKGALPKLDPSSLDLSGTDSSDSDLLADLNIASKDIT